jgi:glycosyltransferase involved in cell wall biosynthesis
MLSILIPTYNYNVVPLVSELIQQVSALQIEYEILIQDDASTQADCVNQNLKLSDLPFVRHIQLSKNVGRGANINILTQQAQYPWILLLDCDMLPVDDFFLSNYSAFIKQNKDTVVFGGICYHNETPQPDTQLRWKFGMQREAIPLAIREKKSYQHTLTSNLLAQKTILEATPFHPNIRKYGYEDLVFVLELEKKGITIKHIHNPLFHENLESGAIFLNKTEEALGNLKQLIETKILPQKATRISCWSRKLDFFPVNTLIVLLFKVFRNALVRHLSASDPKLFLFDFYKLGYYMHLIHKK